jgi:C4-type Zn-finger protein
MVKSKGYKQSLSLNKRKRGIIRKAIEMSINLSQQVYIAIADPVKKSFIEYKSVPKFDLNKIENYEMYDNDDYEALSNKFITKNQLEEIQHKHRPE